MYCTTRATIRAAVLAALFLAGDANGVGASNGCPWKSVKSATATTNSVVINGKVYYVSGKDNREAFEQVLASCGENEAADAFVKWRKRLTWAHMGSVVMAVKATKARDQMLAALTD